jgi:hypothetical protein
LSDALSLNSGRIYLRFHAYKPVFVKRDMGVNIIDLCGGSLRGDSMTDGWLKMDFVKGFFGDLGQTNEQQRHLTE